MYTNPPRPHRSMLPPTRLPIYGSVRFFRTPEPTPWRLEVNIDIWGRGAASWMARLPDVRFFRTGRNPPSHAWVCQKRIGAPADVSGGRAGGRTGKWPGGNGGRATGRAGGRIAGGHAGDNWAGEGERPQRADGRAGGRGAGGRPAGWPARRRGGGAAGRWGGWRPLGA